MSEQSYKKERRVKFAGLPKFKYGSLVCDLLYEKI